MADIPDFFDQKMVDELLPPVVPLSREIFHHVGAADRIITRPDWGNRKPRFLVMHCEGAAVRVKLGNQPASHDGAAPAATLLTGEGSFLLAVGDLRVFPAPSSMTTAGSAAGSILTYWWLP